MEIHGGMYVGVNRCIHWHRTEVELDYTLGAEYQSIIVTSSDSSLIKCLTERHQRNRSNAFCSGQAEGNFLQNIHWNATAHIRSIIHKQ